MNGGKKTVIATLTILAAAAAIATSRAAISAERSELSPTISSYPPADADPDLLLVWAENLLAAQCMAEVGHLLVVDWPDVNSTQEDAYAEMYGATDPAVAFQAGYGINPQLHNVQLKNSDPNWAYVRSLNPAEDRQFQLAYFGDPADSIRIETDDGWLEVGGSGCLADARTRLYGSLREWVRLDAWASSLHPRAHDLVTADDSYPDILMAWRECMDRSGYSVRDPGDSRSKAATQLHAVGAEKALAMERSVAAADARCNSETRMREQSVKLHDKYVAQIVASERMLADNYRARRTAAILTAERLAVPPT